MKTVVIGLLGTTLDAGPKNAERWSKWRPTVALCQHEDLVVDRLDLICPPSHRTLAKMLIDDIAHVSPETTVVAHERSLANPWDLGEVYATLSDFARGYAFNTDKEQYLVHITTGTHIAQICMFLLTETRHFPARLIQTSPAHSQRGGPGSYAIIDLDLSKYDAIAARFQKDANEGSSFLKFGIETKNARYNQLVEQLEQVAVRSSDPVLLLGPTGSGKTRLAKQIFELKKARRLVTGDLIEFNCATARGDGAMSMLFGHVKGAFTGAIDARQGLLRKSDKGVLFLDEVGELGLDQQAMLLRALEDKCFYPVGSDREVDSDFQLLAGTNRDLGIEVKNGHFREDLLARINMWTYALPRLADRPEDMEPNLDFELESLERSTHKRVTFSREARTLFLRFARSKEAIWPGNFRDFAASIRRMVTLADGGRVSDKDVSIELDRLRKLWHHIPQISTESGILNDVLGVSRIADLDRFDRVQLADVLSVCAQSQGLSDAGRVLFAVSRAQKSSTNDADRLRKYLARFSLTWADIREAVDGGRD